MESKEMIEQDIIVSTNKEYEKVIREGIKSFNNKNHPDIQYFKYIEKRDIMIHLDSMHY